MMYAGHEFLLSCISLYTYMNFTFVSHLEERERERQTERERERKPVSSCYISSTYLFVSNLVHSRGWPVEDLVKDSLI